MFLFPPSFVDAVAEEHMLGLPHHHFDYGSSKYFLMSYIQIWDEVRNYIASLQSYHTKLHMLLASREIKVFSNYLGGVIYSLTSGMETCSSLDIAEVELRADPARLGPCCRMLFQFSNI